MSLDSLHPIGKTDIPAAVNALNDAFQDDVLWHRVFEQEEDQERCRKAFFECPLRYGLKYGKAYASSPKMEGVAVWLPGRFADMSLWRMVRSGAILPGVRMGKRASHKLKILSDTVGPDRDRHMKGAPYVYLMIIGVVRAHQGEGIGKRLLETISSQCDAAALPLYLETETEGNLPFYEKHGFETLDRVVLPEIDLPMWEMVRRPMSRE